jgi:ABC-type sugar transport system substrate-binding protein
MGFSQVGAESEWRTANTVSIKDAAKQAGVNLKFADAQQKQENQVKAIRSFIAQKVDVIAFSPVVESGWETVLREAKAAKIPVILTDRAVNVSDKSLYVTFIGSDFVEEGRRAGRWLLDKAKSMPAGDINIVELQAPWARRLPSTARPASRKSSRRAAPEDHPLADRRLHPRQGQGSDGSLPQGRGQEDQRALRAQ